MAKDHIAKASATINAPRSAVWDALVNPQAIKEYMFGTTVVSDWEEGSPIVWKGEWKGKSYEDKGVILKFEPEQTLQYSHYSPLTGEPDVPENYHTVTIDLTDEGDQTGVTLTQDKNGSEEERDEAENNWSGMLQGLQKVAES